MPMPHLWYFFYIKENSTKGSALESWIYCKDQQQMDLKYHRAASLESAGMPHLLGLKANMFMMSYEYLFCNPESQKDG